MIYALSVVLLLFGLSTVRALRDEHLVILRWPVGYFFMERGSDGRYSIFSAARLPVVIARYGVASASTALAAALGSVWIGSRSRRVATAR